MIRYAIGDIHGGLQTFLALIQKIQPKYDDRFYLLGDYVDRGSDSCGVLETIIRMQEAGCDIRPVLGNHDDMLLRSVTGNHHEFSKDWLEGWGQDTLKSFGIKSPDELPARYLNFLEALPLAYRDGNYLLVHAGLDMTKDDPVTETEPVQMLWGEAAYLSTGRDLNGITLVTGHKIRTIPEIRKSLLTNHINIDNGAFAGLSSGHGRLVVLNLDTLKIATQPWLDGEVIL